MLLTCIRTKFSLPRQSPSRSSGTASAAPPVLIPAFGAEPGTPYAPSINPQFRQPPVSTSAAFRNFGIALPASARPLAQPRHQPPALVREICNQVSNPSLRPTYREVTACGGTFPDTVTYLHGLNTPIGPVSFRETRSPQAPHLPENGTFIQNRRICGFQAVARSPLPAPAAATSWLS